MSSQFQLSTPFLPPHYIQIYEIWPIFTANFMHKLQSVIIVANNHGLGRWSRPLCSSRALPAASLYAFFALVPMSFSDSEQPQSTSSSKEDMTSALQAGIAKGKKAGTFVLRDFKSASREAVRGIRSGQVCLYSSDIGCLAHRFFSLLQ
jgi:hypothetical protein